MASSSVRWWAAADRYSHFLDHVSHIRWQNRVAHQSSDHKLGPLCSARSARFGSVGVSRLTVRCHPAEPCRSAGPLSQI